MRKISIILSIFFCVTNVVAQKILPDKSAVIDTVTRAQCKQIVKEIKTMRLKCDTVFRRDMNTVIDGISEGLSKNIDFVAIYFDKKGRLRKYLLKQMSDGDLERYITSAYYNENGELVYIYLYNYYDCGSGEEFYYIDKGRIVDFSVNVICDCCDGKDELTKKEVNRIRGIAGTPLKASVDLERPLTNFIYAETLLKILQNDEYNENDEYRK